MLSKTHLASKTTIAVLVLFLAFLGKIKLQQYRDQAAIEKEKAKLIQQSQDLEKRNQELSQTLSYLNTEDFKDSVARQQLNLKKEGELVYNFSEIQQQAGSAPTAEAPALSNPQKWWHYFFK